MYAGRDHLQTGDKRAAALTAPQVEMESKQKESGAFGRSLLSLSPRQNRYWGRRVFCLSRY